MKLALYLPNFREKVTVKELEDLTSRAEALDFAPSGHSIGSSSRKPKPGTKAPRASGCGSRSP
jgi:hypothetical protein